MLQILKKFLQKTRYLFCYKPKYKRSRSPFISKVFLFHFCHHAVNMYGTMPLTLTVWLYSDTNKKKPLNALGLVRRTKTSVHKIVNFCLQYLSSLFYKNGVNSATIYPIIYNAPSYPLMKWWSSDSYHDEKCMIGYFWKLFSPEINVRMTNLAQFCQIWVILSTLWLLILLKKEQSVQWLKSKPKTY